jgi:hypothetical protein
MKTPNTPQEAIVARQAAIRSLLANEARIVLERSKLTSLVERAEDATRRAQQQQGILNAAETHDRKHARRHYEEQTAALLELSKAAQLRTLPRMPLSPSTPPNAYSDPNYPQTYEGYATMETFSIAAIIDNTEPLYNRKIALFAALLELEPDRRTWPHLDLDTGCATVDALIYYAPLIMAALEELRRMREPIDVTRLDVDDLIHTFSMDYNEYIHQQRQAETIAACLECRSPITPESTADFGIPNICDSCYEQSLHDEHNPC